MGWKDVLKPIRDRLDDLFPPNEPGQKQREARQRRDLLKGFKYLESFDELEAWSPQDVDPLQVSNTPLLPRESASSFEKANLTLLHDYAGNYHDYESSQGVDVDEERYCCEYLQFVHVFVYFSHKLVCIPPPSWTNTLHRNGVKVLGTFIVEPGSSNVERILQAEEHESISQQSSQVFLMASRLAQIARAYGFDGWLINVEKTFPLHHWNLGKLEGFVEQLRKDMGDGGSVIWYDALTTENKVIYQNGLTKKNLPFLKCSGSLLTNYCWDLDKLREAKIMIRDNCLNATDLLFGVDVWAQTKQPKQNPRTTWPRNHGGGTNSGLAVAEIASCQLSVGIFGPAMPYEHFGRHGKAVDRSMWEGTSLPEGLKCDCGDDSSEFHAENLTAPITRFAKQFPAGSRYFFYTNFERAFSQMPQTGKIRAQIGSQSVLPGLIDHDVPTKRHMISGDHNQHCCTLLLDHPARVLITTKRLEPGLQGSSGAVSGRNRCFTLFKLALSCDQPLRVYLRLRPLLPYRRLAVGCVSVTFANDTTRVLRDSRPTDDGFHIVDTVLHETAEKVDGTILEDTDNTIVTELGVSLDSFDHDFRNPADVLEIYAICIQPAHVAQNLYGISDIHVEDRNESHFKHMRLCWKIHERISKHRECPVEHPRFPDGTLDKRPWSEVTGPFSHFRIRVNGEEVGRAHALEYVLPQSMWGKLRRGEECQVQIIGVTFWGVEWESDISDLPDVARDWEFV
ncbi:glycoside hydrolase family 85 protein [Viridothelium virens]|uniref:Glycoside hydrolase family 85 protein n=1 Tax=Viridothelium virens TaxID=1048519 RepID=A0A6A6H2S4_VIRVR|nr:glycoside hydrolase family 85 protein [Viridothelium virens]